MKLLFSSTTTVSISAQDANSLRSAAKRQRLPQSRFGIAADRRHISAGSVLELFSYSR